MPLYCVCGLWFVLYFPQNHPPIDVHHIISALPFLPALLSSVVAVEMLAETTFGLGVVTAGGDVCSLDVGETREELSSGSMTVTARPASPSPSAHQYQPD